jgi:4-aminobutyrate aminotransferase-like enzyme
VALEMPGARFSLSVRSQGLLAGLELRQPDGRPATEAVVAVLKTMLQRGFILLPEGEHANVISFTPPLVISERQLGTAVGVLGQALRELDPA